MRRLAPAAAFIAAMIPALPAHAISFGRVDRNRDGAVSYAEARTSMNRMSEVHFDKCDRNGDGVVDKAEFGCLAGIYNALYVNQND